MYTSSSLYHLLQQEDDCFQRLFAHLDSMPGEMIITELEDHSFVSIRAHLVHLLKAGNLMLKLLGDETEVTRDPDDLFELPELRTTWSALIRRMAGWLQGMSEAELDHFQDFVWPSGRETRMPRGTMYIRALFHMAHHKGQIVQQCRLHGYPAPNTEIVWVAL